MGRPRTPTALLEARGAYTRHPERRGERANEPACLGPVGDPPEYFDDAKRICWNELKAMAAPGVLTVADRALLEAAARLLDEIRQLTETVMVKDLGPIEIRKAVKASEVTAFKSLLSAMGLTPVDRSKVIVPKVEDDDPSGFGSLQ